MPIGVAAALRYAIVQRYRPQILPASPSESDRPQWLSWAYVGPCHQCPAGLSSLTVGLVV